MSRELIEKMARALCADGGFDPSEIMANDGPRWRYYVPQVRLFFSLLSDPANITPEMVTAACESRAKDDEGEFPALADLIDFSGENKTHTVVRTAIAAAFSERAP